jgi:hypothetical protein
MAVTLGANVIGLAISILLYTIWVCHCVSANGFKTVKLTRHFANVYKWKVRHCFTLSRFGLVYLGTP